MNQRLTRRRFGQLAIVGSAAAGLTYLANKTLAQTPLNLDINIINGVRPSPVPSTNDALTPEVDSTDLGPPNTATTEASTARGLELLSLNLGIGEVTLSTTLQVLQDGTTPILRSGEQLTGLTSLTNGTLLVAITPVSTSNNGASPTRLTFLGTSPTTVTVSGLEKQEALESLLVLKYGSLIDLQDDPLIGLVVNKNGTPPVRLVDINPETGAITDRSTLSEKQRISNLAQCPDGKIYTTVVETLSEKREGVPDGAPILKLVQLDLGQNKLLDNTKVELSLDKEVWIGGLSSLVCSPVGQLFAFGNRWHEPLKYLHSVNVETGEMTRLQAFDVALVTI